MKDILVGERDYLEEINICKFRKYQLTFNGDYKYFCKLPLANHYYCVSSLKYFICDVSKLFNMRYYNVIESMNKFLQQNNELIIDSYSNGFNDCIKLLCGENIFGNRII